MELKPFTEVVLFTYTSKCIHNCNIYNLNMVIHITKNIKNILIRICSALIAMFSCEFCGFQFRIVVVISDDVIVSLPESSPISTEPSGSKSCSSFNNAFSLVYFKVYYDSIQSSIKRIYLITTIFTLNSHQLCPNLTVGEQREFLLW